MSHFDAKHQKSEAKTKVNKRKFREKIEAKRKLSKKIDNVFFFTRNELGSEIMRKILNFASFEAKKFSPSFCFEAKITKSKRSEKLKAKKSEKREVKFHSEIAKHM